MSRSRLGKQAQEMFGQESTAPQPTAEKNDWVELNQAVWNLGQNWLQFWGLYPL
jgi:hypothetical protein